MTSGFKLFRRFSPDRFVQISGALACLAMQQLHAADIGSEDCGALTGQTIGGVTVTAADWLVVEPAAGQAVCVVAGHQPPYLDIEVVLPSEWSGRYMQQGGGGFDGFIQSAVLRDEDGEVVGLHEAVARFGAVRAASNGGNRQGVEGEAAPDVWLNDGPDAARSLLHYSYLSLGTTLDFAHGLAEQVYGRLPDYGYFDGCSNGGRNAYIVAQRWPQHFDGIVSGCEPMNMPGTTTAWLSFAGVEGTPAELATEQYTHAYDAAVSSCDADDGRVDGIIANPAACGFEPQSLACEVSDAELCLSAAQVGTLEMLLSDIVDSSGTVLSSGFYWADFGRLANAFSGLGGVYAVLATGDTAWLQAEKRRQFSPDEHHHPIGNGLIRAGLAHDRIAIAQYVASGKKLISWHAGADDLLTPADHARLFDDMMATAEALAVGTGVDVHDNARFFIVPGGNHGAGVHPAVGWIEAIIEWTENGNAPQSLIYEQDDGSTIPVCRFPAYPRGTGSGYACSDG